LQRLRAQRRQPVVQFAAGHPARDRAGGANVNRPGVQSGVHPHQANARFGVARHNGALARHNGALDRGRAAPARQQRRMNVDATQPGDRQHRRRQNQPVRGDHQQIRL